VGPAPGGGLPLRRHCCRPNDVLSLPQQTSSDGDVGGTKPLHPRTLVACLPLWRCACLPAAAAHAGHWWQPRCACNAWPPLPRCCTALPRRGLQLHRCSLSLLLRLARVLPALQWRRGDAEQQPPGTCTRLHHCQELPPPLRIRVGASHAHRAPPTSHACEVTPRTCSASSASCTAVPTTNMSMSRDAPSPWLTQIDSAPLAARTRCSTSRSWCLLRGLPRVVCEELRRDAAPAG
jgi:hypothetical protein